MNRAGDEMRVGTGVDFGREGGSSERRRVCCGGDCECDCVGGEVGVVVVVVVAIRDADVGIGIGGIGIGNGGGGSCEKLASYRAARCLTVALLIFVKDAYGCGG